MLSDVTTAFTCTPALSEYLQSTRTTFPDKKRQKQQYQYKIIHNVLPTKVSLFKAKMCDDAYTPNVLLTGIPYIRYVFAVSINFNLFF